MQSNDIIATIKARKSVRTYNDKPLIEADCAALLLMMEAAGNPFGETVHVHIADKSKGEKLGVSGIVRGAQTFLGVSAPLTPLSPLAMGYQFESLLLGATAIGLGTVWLGGSFKRPPFARAMGVGADEWLAAISPVGYEAARKGSAEKIMRSVMKADERELWRDIFTEDGFQVQLTEESAGEYAVPLEMLRWAPSAANGQPWRVVKKDNVFYFYETHKASLSDAEKRLKQMDLGIALAHFHLTAQQLGLKGYFEQCALKDVHIPEDTFYHMSWVCE